eukprot:5709003-Prymnesium_polylepis.1
MPLASIGTPRLSGSESSASISSAPRAPIPCSARTMPGAVSVSPGSAPSSHVPGKSGRCTIAHLPDTAPKDPAHSSPSTLTQPRRQPSEVRRSPTLLGPPPVSGRCEPKSAASTSMVVESPGPVKSIVQPLVAWTAVRQASSRIAERLVSAIGPTRSAVRK